MAIWALADLHLSKSTPSKDMAIFGPSWEGYMDKIEEHWKKKISKDDLVLLPGDISWAMKLEEAVIDLNWIDALPGTKVMIRGNHDYWWSSNKKMQEKLPPSISFIHNNAFHWKGVAVGGSRLWDTPEYHFSLDEKDEATLLSEADLLIFEKELIRLEHSLKEMDQTSSLKIVMTHYPPLGLNLKESRVSLLLEKFNINMCVFGHLHHLKRRAHVFGERNGIHYFLTAADYLEFEPRLLVP
ncbi:MAG: metallophosphoesterase [Candidatus Rhabdochlamydia sp.]